MVILKKIKAATLVEILVASAIILIVFSISSLSLNNIFKGVVTQPNGNLHNRIKELNYFIEHDKITIPFYEENELWDISIEKKEKTVFINALHKASQKETQMVLYE